MVGDLNLLVHRKLLYGKIFESDCWFWFENLMCKTENTESPAHQLKTTIQNYEPKIKLRFNVKKTKKHYHRDC